MKAELSWENLITSTGELTAIEHLHIVIAQRQRAYVLKTTERHG